ncbi:RNA 2',3'-cyclic phosphodiesterase [Alkalibacterium psychrotolerans]
MRVFIAIELSEKVKGELSSIQQSVKKAALSGRFTSIDNFHLTVHFIGEVNQQELDEIKSAMDRTASQTGPFQLSLSELGSFKKKNKEIVWVGVNGNVEALQQLNKDVLKNLSTSTLTDIEINYVPHLTLGRQIVLASSLSDLNETIGSSKTVIPVDSLSLMESKRVNNELVYEPIYRVKLTDK